MFSVAIQLPSGFIDIYTFETMEDLLSFEETNKDCKFGPIFIKTNKEEE